MSGKWGRTPNYCTTEEHAIRPPGASRGSSDIILPSGSFVRPMSTDYVPTHILDLDHNKYYDKERETFAYTRYGIVLIPKHKIREN